MSREFAFTDKSLFDKAYLSHTVPGLTESDLNLSDKTLLTFPLAGAANLFRVDGLQVVKNASFSHHVYTTVSLQAIETALGSDVEWVGTKTFLTMMQIQSRQPLAPIQIAAPEVNGRRHVGFQLAVSKARFIGTPGPMKFYQWLRAGVPIAGAVHPWYVQTTADLGAIITLRVMAVNRYGVATATTVGGAATALAPVYTPVASGAALRYIAPVAQGTGDGSSAANAAGVTSLTRLIGSVGPGGEVLIASNLGDYVMNDAAFICMGGAAGNPVKIRGVDFATGRDAFPVFRSTRDQPIDLGRSLGLPSSQNRGAEIFTFRTASANITVSTSTDAITDTAGVFSGVPNGTPVVLSVTGGSPVSLMPDPLISLQRYYFRALTATTFRLAPTKADAIAGTNLIDFTTTGTGTITCRVIGDLGTATFDPVNNWVTVPADIYTALADGRSVQFTTTGTLPAATMTLGTTPPTEMPLAYFYYVKKLGSNRLRLYEQPKAVDKDLPFTITSAGTGVHTVFPSESPVGPNHIEWRHISLKDCGAGDGAINFRNWCGGLVFEDIHADNVYRAFTNTSVSGSVLRDASVLGLTIRRGHVYGCERSFIRMRFGSRDILIEDCWADSRRFFGQPFASLFVMSWVDNNVTTGATVGAGPCNVVYNRCGGMRAYQDAGAGEYWNADIFETSQDDCYNTTYNDCEASWATDGAFDDKCDILIYNRCEAAFCKRHYRLWNSAVLNDCISLEPQGAGTFFGENGGRAHFGIFKNGMTVDVNGGYFMDVTDTAVFTNEITSGNANGVVIDWTNVNFRLDPAGRFTLPAGGGITNIQNFVPNPVVSAAITLQPANAGSVVPTSSAVDSIIGQITGITPATARHVALINDNGDFYVDASFNIRVRQSINYGAGNSKAQTFRVIDGASSQDIAFTYFSALDPLLVGVGAAVTQASGNMTLAEPSGVAANDLLVASIGYRGTAAFAAPAGWTIIGQAAGNTATDGTAKAGGVMMYRFRGATAPDLVFTRTGGNVARGNIIAYRNVALLAPDAISLVEAAVGSATISGGSVTTTEVNDLLVFMSVSGRPSSQNGADAATSPATASGTLDTVSNPSAGTWRERLDTSSATSPQMNIAVFDALKAEAGNTGTITALASSSQLGLGIVAAFRRG